jgi:DNA-binding NtrC family response regulator
VLPRDSFVVVVDDNATIRQLIRTALEGAQFNVLEAASGEEALCLFDLHGSGIVLMVTDVGMRDINGVALAARVLKRRPSLRVLFASALGGAEIFKHPLPEGAWDFLQKPFRLADLVGKVRQMVEAVPKKLPRQTRVQPTRKVRNSMV